MNLSHDQSVAILLEEWRMCETAIRTYDDLGMKIKTWSITLFSGSIFLAINTSSPGIALAFLPAAFAFWFFDSLYKSYQIRFIKRVREISAHLRFSLDPSKTTDQPPETEKSFIFPNYDQKFRSQDDFEAALSCMFLWTTATLYIPLSVLSLVIALATVLD